MGFFKELDVLMQESNAKARDVAVVNDFNIDDVDATKMAIKTREALRNTENELTKILKAKGYISNKDLREVLGLSSVWASETEGYVGSQDFPKIFSLGYASGYGDGYEKGITEGYSQGFEDCGTCDLKN